jgi:PAS domain S-box-containing protein
MHESEQRFCLLVNSALGNAIYTLDPDGFVTSWNAGAELIKGYTREEILGRHFGIFLTSEDRAAGKPAQILRAARSEGLFREEGWRVRKDGSRFWASVILEPLKNAEGQLVGFAKFTRDESRRHDAEEAKDVHSRAWTTASVELESVLERLKLATDSGGIGIWDWDIQHDVMLWDEWMYRLYGTTRQVGSTGYELWQRHLHPDDRLAAEQAVADGVSGAKPYNIDFRIIWNDGSIHHIRASGHVTRDTAGRPLRMIGCNQDITPLIIAEKARVEQQVQAKRWLELAEGLARVGHWTVSVPDNEIFLSDEVYRIHGLDKDSYVPSLVSGVKAYHPDDRRMVETVIASAIREKSSFEFQARVIRTDGETRHVLSRGVAQVDHEGDVTSIFGVMIDITDQHLVAEALAESRRGFETLANLSPAGIFRTDTAGEVTYVNAAWLRLSGLTRAQALGPGWAAALPENDRIRVQTDWAAAVKRGESYKSEFRFMRGDGTMSWVAVVSAPDLDQDGRIIGHIGVNIDITVAKASEAALNVAREQAENATLAKAKFLANMSHEIRTPMNGVIGFTDLLLRSELSDEQRRHTLLIAESGKAMMQLLNDILDLSKADAGQMTITAEPVNIRHLLRGCVALMSPLALEKGLGLLFEVEPDVYKWLSLDGLRIRQVVLNLLGNAVKFTRQGQIVLRVAQAPSDPQNLVIAIIDSGSGIAPDRQAAIFDEFVQASDGIARDHGGTGLGLTISRKLVKLMGGELSLDSEVGCGSCFSITLPAKPVAPPADDQAADRDGVLDRRRTARTARTESAHHVLLVEDHDINQALMTDMLHMLGVAVDVAENGVAAIERVRKAAQSDKPYALVLMDMQMPVMGGVDAARAIRAAGHDAAHLPIIALTANAYAEDVASCLDAGMQAHLAKPVDVDALSATLARWCQLQPDLAAVVAPIAKPSLQARYDARKLDTLDRVAALVQGGTFSDDAMSDVIDALHKLTGTAGMFGESELGDVAQRLEQGLLTWDRDELAAHTEAALGELKAAAC